ncbi:MAG TPA: hypothetical protein VEI97_14200, partial [bacterium]|nr:hypothetical protein [bacterium]
MSDDTPQPPVGPLGDGALQAGKYNMRLMRRAIKGGWNIPDETKQAVAEQMKLVVECGRTERDQIAAAKVLLEADKLDQEFQLTQEDREAPATLTPMQQQVNVAVVGAVEGGDMGQATVSAPSVVVNGTANINIMERIKAFDNEFQCSTERMLDEGRGRGEAGVHPNGH